MAQSQLNQPVPLSSRAQGATKGNPIGPMVDKGNGIFVLHIVRGIPCNACAYVGTIVSYIKGYFSFR
jgi:hypothetical protein